MRTGCRLAVLAAVGLCWSECARAQPQPPPRDRPVTTAQKGTASIRGRVFAGDTGKPLRRARITINAPELGGTPRNASTDADGAYEFTELPAGRYTLRVTRGGYLALQYGQRRPLEQGKPLELLDKQVLDKVDFSLPRMSAIAGRVVDELGDPIDNVQVLALRMMYFNGRRQMTPARAVSTNEDGEYRIAGLAPGSYVVSATTRDTWSVVQDGVKRVMGFAPTYFPGTPRVAEARRLDLKLGQNASNVDIALVPASTATLSGTAFDSHGRPYTDVNLRAEVRGEDFGMFGSAGTARVQPDGSFRIPNIPPGDYTLAANTPRDSAEPDVALQPITVDGVDVDGIILTGSRGGVILGRVQTEEGDVPSLPRLAVNAMERINGQNDPTVLGTFRNAGTGAVNPDGTFRIDGVFGRPRFRFVALPDTWAVKTIERDGRDIADDPIEMRPGEEMSGVVITITNRVSVVSGTLADDRGRPVTDGTVIIFAEDATKWGPDGRMIRAGRPDQQGQWRINGLPPGRFLAVAVEYVENGAWNDPEFLETLRERAQKLELKERDTVKLDLKFVTP